VRILAIESATAMPAVALLEGPRVLAERPAGGSTPGSEALLPAIDALLRQASIQLAALDGFALAIGPDSFTGLRVGLATLKGLAFDDPRPVAAVSTLAALARRAGDPRPEPVAALLDARRDELYAAVWDAGSGTEPRVPEGLHRIDTLAARLPARCLLVGDAVGPNLSTLQARLVPGVRPAPPCAQGPCAVHVGILGARILAAGLGSTAAELVPRYLRRARAEARRTGRATGPS